MKAILENPHIKWNYKLLSSNKFIKIEDILNNHKLPWDWKQITYNPNLKLKHIINNPDKPWDYQELLTLPIIDWDTINKYEFKVDWKRYNYMLNPNLTWEILYENYNLNPLRAQGTIWSLGTVKIETFEHYKVNIFDVSNGLDTNHLFGIIKNICCNNYTFNNHYYQMFIVSQLEKISIYYTIYFNYNDILCLT
jgi:hypothetical protein